ncbi:MAG: hypothetical protein HYY29_01190 [Chloroflexi bacterium]|nr:hypothetical protein [Chloroflexota bacterium]
MNRDEILSYCLDDIMAGRSTVNDCIQKYPYLKDELLPLIEIALQIEEPAATPSPEFKQRLRNRLLSPAPPKKSILDFFRPAAILRRARFSLIAMGLVPVFAIGGTTVYAYERSLPDEALYPLKMAVENVQLTLATDPESKADVHLKLAERRTDEIADQASRGRTIAAATVDSAAGQLDKAIREISAIPEAQARPFLERLSKSTVKQETRLSEALAKAPPSAKPAVEKAITTTKRGNLIAEMTSGNTSLLAKAPPSVLDARLEESHFKIEGTLVSATASSWTIDGVTLPNVSLPPGAAVAVDRDVKIEGVLRNGRVFISKIEVKDKKGAEFKLRGVFTGASPDGTTWYVGGIGVPRPDNMPAPTPGKQVTIERTARARPADAGRAEQRQREDRSGRTPVPTSSPAPAPPAATPSPEPAPVPVPSPTPAPTIRTITPSPAPKPPAPGGTGRPESGKDGKKDEGKKDGNQGQNRGSGGPTRVAPSPVPTPGQTREPTKRAERDDDKDGKRESDRGNSGPSGERDRDKR